MPQAEYVKANESDFFDLVDFLNFVFSHAYQPNDFEKMLPGLYSVKNFMTGANYMVKEDGKIVANVGAYPATYDVCGALIQVTGITSVAVHPRARSKGYMRKLMEMALNDMRKDGTALSFLMGRRQRYEYFGFTPCGVRFNYSCNKDNIRHKNKTNNSEIRLKELHTGDTEAFDNIFHRYHTIKAHIKRPYHRFTDIMATWENKTIGVYQKDMLIGYISASKDFNAIHEIYIDDLNLLTEILGVYLTQYRRNDVSVAVYPTETTLVAQLSTLAESVSIFQDINFNILDYPLVLNAFLKLKNEAMVLPDGVLTVCIRDIANITIAVSDNRTFVSVTNEKPDVECTHPEAMQLFFSPVSAFSMGQLDGNAFARCLLPIPLFIRSNDRS